MPELPEVETTVSRFRRKVAGKLITGFSASWPRQVRPGVAAVRWAVVGRTIVKLSRRGKHIVFHLDDGSFLLLHLGMSGMLTWAGDRDPAPAHARAVLKLGPAERLYFCDARKFGRIRHTADLDQTLGALGYEPLSRQFTPTVFRRALASRSRRLKPLIMDQTLVCGLGNIYTDEALHRAGLHPQVLSDRLTPEQIRGLHRAIRAVLRQAIRHSGTSFDWAYPGGRMQSRLRVYRRTGEPCGRCGTRIVRILVGGRSTHFCPRCQRR